MRPVAMLALLAAASICIAQTPAKASLYELAGDRFQLTELESRLNEGADPNAFNNDGWSPLMLAALQNNPKGLKLLLAHGASAGLARKRGLPGMPAGSTALHYADSEPCAKLLIEGGANAAAVDEDGKTPLESAIWNTRRDVAQYLLTQGASKARLNQLLFSAAADIPRLLKLCLELGADPNILGHDGVTPMMNATGFRDPLVSIQLLLDQGARVETEDSNGETALFHAVRRGWLDDEKNLTPRILSLLLANGAKTDRRNKKGKTPLLFATYRRSSSVPCNHAVLKCLLLEGKANPNFPTPDGWTPLMHALGDPVAVQMLLDAGADPRQKDDRGNSALSIAERSPELPALALLRKAIESRP